MNIIISGVTGFIGSKLAASLSGAGHRVWGVSRNPDKARVDGVEKFIAWPEPSKESQFADSLQSLAPFSVVHLSGANVGQAWTAGHKKKILESRVQTTAVWRRALAASDTPVAEHFIGVAAVGIYGDTGDRAVEEMGAASLQEPLPVTDHPAILEQNGLSFLAGVCRAWEGELNSIAPYVKDHSVLRLGVVFGEEGPLPKMALPFKMHIGGKSGSGKQFVPWVHIDDVIGVMTGLANGTLKAGLYNVVAPESVRNSELSAGIAKAVGTHSALPVPSFAFKLILRDGAAIITGSQRVVPAALQKAGYSFKYPALQPALENLL